MTGETVYLAHSNSRRSFHTDPDCHAGPDDPIEKPRAVAERMNIEECRFCSGDYEPSETTQFDTHSELAAQVVSPEVSRDD